MIPGLRYVPGYLDAEEHDRLLSAVDSQTWLMSIDHRVQVFGYHYSHRTGEAFRIGQLPGWASGVAARLHRDGLIDEVPNQLVANEYRAGTGFFDHVDQAVLGATVVCISLGSTCAMRFTRTEPDGAEELLLEPRSALVLSGEVRWHWKHGISARTSDLWRGGEHPRSRRVSLTFRAVPHVSPGPIDLPAG